MAGSGHLAFTMTSPEPDPGSSPLEQGRKALARGAWEEAVEILEAAAEADPADASAWELLGIAHNWRQETDAAIEARERAYALFRERGDDVASARVSLELANDFFEARGEPAVGNGWLQRARRLLEDLPPSGEHALLAVWDSYIALMGDRDPETAEVHAARGVAVAKETGSRDVGVLALALQGLSRVGAGRVREGLDLVDEAVAGAIGREVTDPQWFYLTCCCMIDACDQVRDYGRSLEWCHRLREFCDRWRVEAFLTNCRLKYTGALLWRGEWERCEEELERALTELRRNRPAAADGALVRLADLRRRQGRTGEAEALLAEAEGHALVRPVRAALALDDGDGRTAVETVEALLRQLPGTARTERVAALELSVRAHLTLDQVEAAEAAAAELASITEGAGTPALRAATLVTRGMVLAARSEHDDARRLFEDAVHLLQDSGSPFEAARVRLELAASLAALDRVPAAVGQARKGVEALERIGAGRDAERGQELLKELEAREDGQDGGQVGRADLSAPKGPLTKRQREVLGLVAEGLSDRDIADRLYLSEHTVHRHVANIMNRLRVGSRAAAVARGVRDELI